MRVFPLFIAAAVVLLNAPASAASCVIDEADVSLRKNGTRSFMDRAGACVIAQGTVIANAQSVSETGAVKAEMTIIHPEFGLVGCLAKEKKADQYVICNAKPWMGE